MSIQLDMVYVLLLYLYIYICISLWADVRPKFQSDRQTDRQAGRQPGRQPARQTDRHLFLVVYHNRKFCSPSCRIV